MTLCCLNLDHNNPVKLGYNDHGYIEQIYTHFCGPKSKVYYKNVPPV